MTTTDRAAGTVQSPETLPATGDGESPDVISDPAKDDTEGQDWSDEGGATPSGPATATPSS